MRYVNGLFCAMLALFAIAQYNDPDPLLWFPIYAIPALWSGLIAWRPHLLQTNRPAAVAFLVCLAAAVVGTVHYWPSLPTDWIDIEEEREGIGMIIVLVALLVAGWTGWRARRVEVPAVAQ